MRYNDSFKPRFNVIFIASLKTYPRALSLTKYLSIFRGVLLLRGHVFVRATLYALCRRRSHLRTINFLAVIEITSTVSTAVIKEVPVGECGDGSFFRFFLEQMTVYGF